MSLLPRPPLLNIQNQPALKMKENVVSLSPLTASLKAEAAASTSQSTGTQSAGIAEDQCATKMEAETAASASESVSDHILSHNKQALLQMPEGELNWLLQEKQTKKIRKL